MKRAVVLAVVLGACGSKKAAAPPPPVLDAEVEIEDEDGVAMELEDQPPKPPPAYVADLPARAHRSECPATCDVGEHDCVNRQIPGVVFYGFQEHLICFQPQVVVDCCAPIDGADSVAVLAALGWADATPAQRIAIARAYHELVRGNAVLESAADEPLLAPTFTAPAGTSTKTGGVVLDSWSLVITLHGNYFQHERATFDAKGTYQTEELGRVDRPIDREEIKRKAIEAAKHLP